MFLYYLKKFKQKQLELETITTTLLFNKIKAFF